MRKKNDRARVFLIGIPHFDWKLLNLMIRRGRFPGFKRLIEDGASGEILPQDDLCSTPVEFTSLITGVRKECHSIGHGKESDGEYADGGTLYTRLDIKAPTLWETALRHGKAVGIYHWLLAWPPAKVRGFMVTGRLSQDENRTYPKKLRDIIWSPDTKEPEYFDPDIAAGLAREYDVDLFLGMEERVHAPTHVLWECVDPSAGLARRRRKEMRDELFECFRCVDDFLGKAQAEFPGSTLIIAADTGSTIREFTIYTLGGETIELTTRLNLGLQLYAVDVYPSHLPKAKPTFHLPGTSQEKKALLAGTLGAIRYKSGENFITDIRWQEYNLSFSFNFRPEFTGDASWGWITLALPDGGEQTIRVIRQTGSACRKGGVFAAMGPSVRRGLKMGQVSVLDIAPTILHLLNVPIPANMQGAVMGAMIANAA